MASQAILSLAGEKMNSVFKNKLFYILILSIILLLSLTIFNLFILFKVNKPADSINKIRIGLSLGTLKEERWIKDRDILVAKIKELGAEIYVQNANNSDDDQLKQVKYLLDQKIDVLIIVPNDLQKSAAAVQLAQKYGVKVISYDRLVMKSNVDLYISFDNTKVGMLMANYLVKKVPKGNYLIINGAPTDNNTKMIKDGYDSVLKKYISNGNIKIIAEEWSPNWMSEYAFKKTDEILQSGKKIDAIITGNDSLAGAVIEALAEYRLAGKIPVVGQDADLAACQRIVEGTQSMTVYKPIDKLAEITAQMAIKLAKGEDLNIKERIFDGKYYVPMYLLEPIAVDKNNIDSTIIKDGFQNYEDVYRYVSKKNK